MKKNPLNRSESAQALKVSRKQLQRSRSSKNIKQKSFHAGFSAGMAHAAEKFGKNERVKVLGGRLHYKAIQSGFPIKRINAHSRRAKRKNPVEKMVLIGESCTRVEYIARAKAKREGLSHPGRPWQHDFSETGARVYGLKDGSVLIKSAKGKPLWGMR